MSIGTITRRFRFCASHRYWVENWDEETNLAAFGNRTSRYGHGHNYVLDVTLRGEINPDTGMVVNLTEVKRIVGGVVDRFDHKFLNADLPYFTQMQPTSENLARLFWRLIEQDLPDGVYLHRIRLYTTANVFAEYHGQDDQAVFSKTFSFSATHRLHSPLLDEEKNADVYGKCNNPNGHGHNYILTVYLKRSIDPVTGMTVPMRELDRKVRSFLDEQLDGKRLDAEVPFFKDKPSTSENLILFIQNSLEAELGDTLWKLKLKETDNNFFEMGNKEQHDDGTGEV